MVTSDNGEVAAVGGDKGGVVVEHEGGGVVEGVSDVVAEGGVVAQGDEVAVAEGGVVAQGSEDGAAKDGAVAEGGSSAGAVAEGGDGVGVGAGSRGDVVEDVGGSLGPGPFGIYSPQVLIRGTGPH